MDFNIIKEIKKHKFGKVIEEVKIANYTSYKVGGNVTLLIYPDDVLKLINLIQLLRQYNIKYKVLGNGSNVIFSDNNYDGVIIKLDKFNHVNRDNTVITVGAGYNLKKLACEMSKLGLSGLEFATGIPGTIGGAVFMNAGAYKSDMGYIVSSIKVLTPDLQIKELYNKDLDFHYRSSFLQKNPDYICLEATIVLKQGDKKKIMALVEERKQKRLISQPLEYPSAGSVFRNPIDDFAGRLIEVCDLKGYQKGGALVSPKHANFIVNVGNATATDVHDLILEVKEKVKKETGVDLIIEQEFVNWE
ncbi:MAG: UDP-N-acetylmuramate dehydrogenase [Bacilli bacterium]|jgi:UDP-N-acetylmuramate dehydrogenase|nr:UDP-N-acetylmuramate dehydrogenase [Bacilli bacterium]